MREVVVAGAVRTPIGRFGGALSGLGAAELGAAAAREALARAGVRPDEVQEAIFGCARQAGGGPNVARQVAWRAGLPQEVPAYTVNMACGSGLKAIDLAWRAVRDGDMDVVLAGGTESMSNVPYLLTGARWGYRMGRQPVLDAMYQDGFQCPLSDMLMGDTAERLADVYRIPREEQDAFALASQQKAGRALAEARFESETVAVSVEGRKGPQEVRRDEHPRPDTSAESLARLPPVFRPGGGTVTAGNSSGITDGAAAVVVAAADRARELGLRPQARITAVAAAGVDPRVMGIGVVPAVRRLLERTGLHLDAFDLIELNEAFAAQVLACDRELRLPADRLNVNGGAIALGHPIGATGARLVVTLLHEMARRRARRGLATLCISGGMGLAAAFEAA
ncbi:MAG TPA: thiolase family protein [Vicinamibacteria bacterium]|nr:thiolase family protein [Vicinamibacteria bacterium]